MDAKVDAESLPGEKVSSQEKTLSLLHCHNLRRNQVKRFLAIVTNCNNLRRDKCEQI